MKTILGDGWFGAGPVTGESTGRIIKVSDDVPLTWAALQQHCFDHIPAYVEVTVVEGFGQMAILKARVMSWDSQAIRVRFTHSGGYQTQGGDHTIRPEDVREGRVKLL